MNNIQVIHIYIHVKKKKWTWALNWLSHLFLHNCLQLLLNFDITNVYLLLLSKKKKISWLSLYSNYTCTVSYKIVYSTLSSRQTNLSSSKVYTSGAIFNWNCPYFWYWGKVLSTLAMKCVFLQDKHMKSTLYMGYISAQFKDI